MDKLYIIVFEYNMPFVIDYSCCRCRNRIVFGFTSTIQSVSPLKVVNSPILDHGEEYLIKQYVITFVSYLRQVGGFLRILGFPPPIKLNATM